MPFRVEFSEEAARQLRKLPPQIYTRLKPHLEALAENPRPPGSIHLQGTKKGRHLRAGDFRILYRIFDDRLVVLVLRVAHRKEAYRRLADP